MTPALRSSKKLQLLIQKLEGYYNGSDYMQNNSCDVSIQRFGNEYEVCTTVYKDVHYAECYVQISWCSKRVEEFISHFDLKTLEDTQTIDHIQLWKLFKRGLGSLNCYMMNDTYNFYRKEVAGVWVVTLEKEMIPQKYYPFDHPKHYFDFCRKTFYHAKRGALVDKKKVKW